MDRTRAVAIVQTISILIAMSFGTVLTKIALGDMTPLTFTWISVLIGMIALAGYTFGLRREKIPPMSRTVWMYIIAIGICNFVLGRIFSTLALDRLPATTSTYLSNFIGFITMGMSIFILKESPTVWQVLGAVVAFLGLRVFFDVVPTGYELVGVGFTLTGITAVAFTNNIARKLALITQNGISNTVISTLALLIGGSITVVAGLALDGPPQVNGAIAWGTLLYSGIVQVALGLTVWNHILRVLRSYEASILGASTVFWTALLAVPMLGEVLKWNQIAGIALMLVGLALVQVRAGAFRFSRRPTPS